MILKTWRRIIFLTLVVLLLASCDSTTSSPTATPIANPTATNGPAGELVSSQTPIDTPVITPGDGAALPTAQPFPTADKAHPVKLTIALGYIPDVQFTPFYVALNKGYYADEGLDVTFKHGIVPDLIKLLGEGSDGINFAAASGDEVIPARANDVPVIYVMTWYRQYPVAAASIVGKGPTLKSPADLKGKTIGVPGPFGSTYTGLLALLKAGGLTTQDVNIKHIGFSQIENLATGKVDVAMVYAANEPTQLRSQGMEVSTLNVADYVKLAANGLVTNVETFKNDPVLVARVVRATLKGIQDTINDPGGSFDQALKQVPEAGGENKEQQLEVLRESVKLMQPKAGDSSASTLPGYTDAEVWSETQDLLYDAKLITKKGRVTEMFSNRFLPTGDR